MLKIDPYTTAVQVLFTALVFGLFGLVFWLSRLQVKWAKAEAKAARKERDEMKYGSHRAA